MAETLHPQPADHRQMPPQPEITFTSPQRRTLVLSLIVLVAGAGLGRFGNADGWILADFGLLVTAYLVGVLGVGVLTKKLWFAPVEMQALHWAIPGAVAVWALASFWRINVDGFDRVMWRGLLGESGVENFSGFGGLVLLVIAGYAFLLAVRGVAQHWRMRRRRRNGWWSKEDHARMAWVQARRHAKEAAWKVIDGQAIATIPPSDVGLRPGEALHSDSNLSYSRFYGMTVDYMRTNNAYYGRPLFVLSSLAGQAIGNSRRRRQAEAMAQAQWREQQVARVLITDQRFLIRTAERWLTFDYGAMLTIAVSPDNWNVVVEFEGTEPLMLGGMMAPFAAVAAAAFRGPETLRATPGMEKLLVG